MCTPLPTPSAAGIGENTARWPSRCAAARAISRVITAWSAAASAAAGATVTSNCRAPYSARKLSGATPAARNAATKLSPNTPWRRNAPRLYASPGRSSLPV